MWNIYFQVVNITHFTMVHYQIVPHLLFIVFYFKVIYLYIVINSHLPHGIQQDISVPVPMLFQYIPIQILNYLLFGLVI